MLIVRTVLSLALVIALIAALAWVARRFLKPDRWLQSRGHGSMKIVERLSIDAKKSLLVVQWHQRRLLIGMTESALTRLDSVEGDHQVISVPEGKVAL